MRTRTRAFRRTSGGQLPRPRWTAGEPCRLGCQWRRTSSPASPVPDPEGGRNPDNDWLLRGSVNRHVNAPGEGRLWGCVIGRGRRSPPGRSLRETWDLGPDPEGDHRPRGSDRVPGADTISWVRPSQAAKDARPDDLALGVTIGSAKGHKSIVLQLGGQAWFARLTSAYCMRFRTRGRPHRKGKPGVSRGRKATEPNQGWPGYRTERIQFPVRNIPMPPLP